MKKRIVVIGGVAAGPSAASKAKRINPDADVVLYEAGSYISYGVCEIPYLLSGEVANPDSMVIYSPEKLRKEKGVSAFIHHYVESINRVKKELSVKNMETGKSVSGHYDALIIATGCIPKKLTLQGADARNVFYIKRLDEAFALKKFIDEEHPQSAVVVGAGYIGLEMAEALIRRGMDVTVIHKSSMPLSAFDDGSRMIIREEIDKNKIRFISDSEIDWLGVGAKNNIVAVGTKKETVETDLVIVAIGVEPNTKLARETGIKLGKFGGIVTTDKMNVTGTDHIFAAGDCCELKNSVTGKPFYQSLATTASRTGWVAGENAAGGSAKFKGAIQAMGLRFFDLEIAHVGITEHEAETAGFTPVTATITASSKVGMLPGNQSIHFTTIADKKSGRMLGANVVGGSGSILRANVLAACIKKGMTVDELSELDLIYNPPVSPLWDGLIISGVQLKKSL